MEGCRPERSLVAGWGNLGALGDQPVRRKRPGRVTARRATTGVASVSKRCPPASNTLAPKGGARRELRSQCGILRRPDRDIPIYQIAGAYRWLTLQYTT